MTTIRGAILEDVKPIAAIARKNDAELGFLSYPMIEETIKKQEALVAVQEGEHVGFCLFHGRKDGFVTLQFLCVSEKARRNKVATHLFYALVDWATLQGYTAIQLKAIVGIKANAFYQAQGFALVGQTWGKVNLLNIWQYSLGDQNEYRLAKERAKK